MKPKELERLIWQADPRNRLTLFIENLPTSGSSFPDKHFWRMLGEIYTQGEGTWNVRGIYAILFKANRSDRHHVMTIDERKALAKLPEVITVHRGFALRNRKGLSWTLGRAKAEWFARRQALFLSKKKGVRARVVSGVCSRADVIAYFTGRKEEEILVDPAMVTNQKISMLTAEGVVAEP